MKKIFISILVIAAVLTTALYFVSRMSDSYAIATTEIKKSESVAKSIGQVEYSLLLGTRHKLQPKDVSCGSLTFLVKGSDSVEFVEVLVRKQDFHKSWEVYDVLEGMDARSAKSCLSGATLIQ
jgi:hypothetical protein